jgi:hypothetical protein
MLVREGFAAVGEHGRPFELLWSGAPDPWDAWSQGGLPPRAPEAAPSASNRTEALIDSAKAAAHERSRGAALKQATERHPELEERLAEVVEDEREKRGLLGVLPAAPDPNPINPPGDDVDDNSGSGSMEENYVEALLSGGAGGPTFEVNTHGDEVEVTSSLGVTVTLTEPELQSLVNGLTQPPAPIADAPGVTQGGLQPVLGGLLGLLDD